MVKLRRKRIPTLNSLVLKKLWRHFPFCWRIRYEQLKAGLGLAWAKRTLRPDSFWPNHPVTWHFYCSRTIFVLILPILRKNRIVFAERNQWSRNACDCSSCSCFIHGALRELRANNKWDYENGYDSNQTSRRRSRISSKTPNAEIPIPGRLDVPTKQRKYLRSKIKSSVRFPPPRYYKLTRTWGNYEGKQSESTLRKRFRKKKRIGRLN